MRNLILIGAGAVIAAVAVVALVLRGALAAGEQAPAGETPGTLWAFTPDALEGQPAPLATWKGQVALVVNTASKCGLTPQYEGLQALYDRYKPRGFVVLGFPSNDFMGQEPGTPAEIREFCTLKYHVTFPLFAKVKVKGADKDGLYAWLTGGGLEEPTWNFTKYLVGRDGRVISRFGPKTAPDDPALLAAIEKALGPES